VGFFAIGNTWGALSVLVDKPPGLNATGAYVGYPTGQQVANPFEIVEGPVTVRQIEWQGYYLYDSRSVIDFRILIHRDGVGAGAALPGELVFSGEYTSIQGVETGAIAEWQNPFPPSRVLKFTVESELVLPAGKYWIAVGTLTTTSGQALWQRSMALGSGSAAMRIHDTGAWYSLAGWGEFAFTLRGDAAGGVPPPPDRDADGIPDSSDDCPDAPGTVALRGCPTPPLDTDGDGVPNATDACPDLPGDVARNGCPQPTRREPPPAETIPDLLVSRVTYSAFKRDPLGLSWEVFPAALVSNRGTATARAVTLAFEGLGLTTPVSIGDLPPGVSRWAYPPRDPLGNGIVLSAGPYSLRVTVDRWRRIVESNEGNNVSVLRFELPRN